MFILLIIIVVCLANFFTMIFITKIIAEPSKHKGFPGRRILRL